MPSPKHKDFDKLLAQGVSKLEAKLPFVLYRKPKDSVVMGIFQSDDNLNFTSDYTESGFVFAPFDTTEEAILIHPDERITSNFKAKPENHTGHISLSEHGKESHLELVESGIEAIQKGDLQKVVLSRKIEIDCPKPPETIFNGLLNNYPNAFCYWFFHPKIGMWCGATPETLVNIEGKSLKTMSLAATLSVDGTNAPNWGAKEIEEQQMVSDYIRQRLDPKMDVLEISEVESIKAGKLWHLKSEVTGEISANVKYGEIIKALHPTPAVCGIPVEAAKTFIKSKEDYQRTFYTGFLGELHLDAAQQIKLYVNLRCMEIEQNTASIFVGGGITLASEPEREWVETQNKSKTMLNML